ncbi:MAG: FHIPEP family type III secretion protein, partial [Alphaproteobacteria bacterium]
IGKQVSLSRAWIPVSGVLTLIGFVPGMPNLMFLVAAAVAGGVGYWSWMREKLAEQDNEFAEDGEAAEAKSPDMIDLDDIADNSAISIQLGYGLVEMVEEDSGGPLTNRITGIRRQVSKALGFVLPAVRIRDDMTLDANTYRIRVGQTIVGEDKIYPDRKLAIPGDETTVKIDGIEVKDPSFGMDATWIATNQQAEAEAKGYVVVLPESVMATHLSQVLHKYASQLIGQDDVQGLLDNLSQSAPNLVESVVPKLVPLHTLTSILRLLLEERVPISDLRRILENLPALAARNLGPAETAEALRPVLAGLLIQQVAPLNQPLPVMTLESDLEHMLISMARQSGEEGLVIENSLAEQILKKIVQSNEELGAEGKQLVMVVSPAIRRVFSHFIRQHIDDQVVLAFTELPETRKIEVVATISNATQQ